MNVLGLCAGIGGLELAIKAVWPRSRVVCYVERDEHAVSVLRDRIAEGDLDNAPIWDDVRTFDGKPWRGCVDFVCAGYPCQGESNAGMRLGASDVRWIWDDVWRIVRETGAGWLAVENVAAHIGRSWPVVARDLAESGWHPEWDCVPAAAVGALHERDRFFCLAANPDSSRLEEPIHWPGDYPKTEYQEQWLAAQRAGIPSFTAGTWPCPEPAVLRVDDGIPDRLDGCRAPEASNPIARQCSGVAGGSEGAQKSVD